MKYKTFRALVIVAATAACGGLFVLGNSWCDAQERLQIERDSRERAREEAYAEEVLKEEALLLERPGGPVARAPSGSVHEVRLRGLLGTPSGAETKLKDLYGGGLVKINVYAEDGSWVRAKVDLDRDDRWDEKWRIEDGVIYRQVAPADDENYGDEAPLDAPEPAFGAADAPAGPAALGAGEAGGPSELRPVDELMLSLLSRPVQAKIKDASKGRPFKINLYSDGGGRFERAKVDLDRDDRWDEKWTFAADGAVSRQVAPADDENYSERFALEAGGRWVAIP